MTKDASNLTEYQQARIAREAEAERVRALYAVVLTATCDHCGGTQSRPAGGIWTHDSTGLLQCPEAVTAPLTRGNGRVQHVQTEELF